LTNFAEAAFHHPAFAQELPRFISKVRRMFTPEEIAAQLARIEHERNEKDEDVPGEDKLLRESPANIVERARQFMTIKELLTATALGTFAAPNMLNWRHPPRIGVAPWRSSSRRPSSPGGRRRHRARNARARSLGSTPLLTGSAHETG
jgi:hypothetical protein